MKKFYTYILYDSNFFDGEKGGELYVGKGCRLRMHHHVRDALVGKDDGGNIYLHNKIRKIYKQEGIVIPVKIMESDDPAHMLRLEENLIAFYGRRNKKTGTLYNLTDGGESPPSWQGKKHSKESIEKMRRVQKGIQAGEKHPMFGKHKTEETKRKISEANKKYRGELHCMYGKHFPKEVGERIGERQRGSKNPIAKLTEADIPFIRQDSRRYREIATDYNVTPTLIGQIKRGLIWTHVSSLDQV